MLLFSLERARCWFSAAQISARDIIEAQATCPALVLAPNRRIGSLEQRQWLRSRPSEAQRGAEEKAGDAAGGWQRGQARMDDESESSNVRCDAMRCTANAQDACPVQSALVHYQRANRLPSAQQHCTRSPFRRGWRMTQAAEWVDHSLCQSHESGEGEAGKGVTNGTRKCSIAVFWYSTFLLNWRGGQASTCTLDKGTCHPAATATTAQSAPVQGPR
jgi:ferredoxin